jgi:cytochrome c
MRLAIVIVVASLAAGPALAATGQDIFNDKCGSCHTVDDTSDTAPTLKGVVGRKIASVAGYPYSDALKAKSALTWTEDNLNSFVTAPNTFAPGTQMPVSEPDAATRKAIIDYLKTVK